MKLLLIACATALLAGGCASPDGDASLDSGRKERYVPTGSHIPSRSPTRGVEMMSREEFERQQQRSAGMPPSESLSGGGPPGR